MRIPSPGRIWSLPKSAADEVHWQAKLFFIPVAAIVFSPQLYSNVSAECPWHNWARKCVVLLVGEAFPKTTLKPT
jgi:hypothetical protein